MDLESLFQKYACQSEDELLECLADAAFEEAKKFKSRLNVRPLRLKHLKKLEELRMEESLVLSMQEFRREILWKVESDWLNQLRQYETEVAQCLTLLFQSNSASGMCSFALALHDYLVEFEHFLGQANLDEYPFEVKSQDEFPTSFIIQCLLIDRHSEASNALAKEKKRLLLFV